MAISYNRDNPVDLLTGNKQYAFPNGQGIFIPPSLEDTVITLQKQRMVDLCLTVLTHDPYANITTTSGYRPYSQSVIQLATLYEVDDNANGPPVAVQGLIDRFTISLPNPFAGLSGNDSVAYEEAVAAGLKIQCYHSTDDMLTWRLTGLETLNVTQDRLLCRSTHLTAFAAVVTLPSPPAPPQAPLTVDTTTTGFASKLLGIASAILGSPRNIILLLLAIIIGVCVIFLLCTICVKGRRRHEWVELEAPQRCFDCGKEHTIYCNLCEACSNCQAVSQCEPTGTQLISLYVAARQNQIFQHGILAPEAVENKDSVTSWGMANRIDSDSSYPIPSLPPMARPQASDAHVDRPLPLPLGNLLANRDQNKPEKQPWISPIKHPSTIPAAPHRPAVSRELVVIDEDDDYDTVIPVSKHSGPVFPREVARELASPQPPPLPERSAVAIPPRRHEETINPLRPRGSQFTAASNPLVPPSGRPAVVSPIQRVSLAAVLPSEEPRPLNTASNLTSLAQQLLAQVTAKFGLTVASFGDVIRVTRVREDSPAQRAGVNVGDRLLRFCGRAVLDVSDFREATQSVRPGERIPLVISRAETVLALSLRVGAQVTEEMFVILQRVASGEYSLEDEIRLRNLHFERDAAIAWN
eukprot:TRINITY_DN30696_c0_g1_i1.p1 TRINITY_DN30696_c0_g1~~TRINITY_DN30696_c0_g1_i1.p1  ORF type:complete len:638 (-),score=62.94 TRINITY_DN30696_c0_g1_i1:2-1915(-)